MKIFVVATNGVPTIRLVEASTAKAAVRYVASATITAREPSQHELLSFGQQGIPVETATTPESNDVP